MLLNSPENKELGDVNAIVELDLVTKDNELIKDYEHVVEDELGVQQNEVGERKVREEKEKQEQEGNGKREKDEREQVAQEKIEKEEKLAWDGQKVKARLFEVKLNLFEVYYCVNFNNFS